MNKKEDVSLNNLLDLDGEIFPMDNGCWVKFMARSICPEQHAPHGIRYSLTLNDNLTTGLLALIMPMQ
ncbi:MAG: hypothetical protein V1793_05235 [Pseudomonadota bacterium]